ncbi:MAG: SpoIIE family protein phosphatase [Bacteroidales bacterium]
MIRKYKYILVLFFFHALLVHGQKGYFQLNGRIYDENKNALGDTKIKVREGNVLVDSMKTTSGGAFSLKMKLQSSYLIEFNKATFGTKKILIDTKVPQEVENNSYRAQNFIYLDDINSIDDWSRAGLPVLKYVYSKEKNDFVTVKMNLKEMADKTQCEQQIKALQGELEKYKLLAQSQKQMIDESGEILANSEKIKSTARDFADSIISAAYIKSQIIKKTPGFTDTDVVKSAVDKSTREITKEDFQVLSVNENDFETKKSIQDVKKKIQSISKIEYKSARDSLDLKKNKLQLRQELFNLAKFQLQIDKLNARTRDDSIRIDQRQALLDAMQGEIEMARQEIEIANNKLTMKDLEIKNKNILLLSSLGGSFLLLILLAFIYYSYRDKKRINLILESQNLEITTKNKILASQNDQIMDSIYYAKRIQDAILPSEALIKSYFPDSFIYFKPKDIVSGDFYWFSMQNDMLFVATVDCTGHGVPGAFMSLIGNSLLNHIVNEKKIFRPSDILKELNSGVHLALSQSKSEADQREDGMDISICRFDKKLGEVQIACANHTALFLQNEEIKEIVGDEISIGDTFSRKESLEFTNHVITFDNNCIMYMFSDGYPDQLGGPKNKKFMVENFKRFLTEHKNEAMKTQFSHLSDAFNEWKGKNKQTDDILVMGIKLNVKV